MKPPLFWQALTPTLPAKVLSPLSYITALITHYRLSRKGWKSSVPVICCGNLTVGGTGKTTVAIELGLYYQQHNIKVAFLTRGYKRKNKIADPILVDPEKHNVLDVGDEALLLAQIAPTWVASNRALSAKAAILNHAQLLIMDDGFQNPTLQQDLPLLVIDGVTGFGNQKALPAGPLREAMHHGLSRAKACILIGEDQRNIRQTLPSDLPVFQAFLEMDSQTKQLAGQSVIAFAGIGRPEKFFHALQENHIQVIQSTSFPDHYFYQLKDLEQLTSLAQHHNLSLVTTPKDYVRLPEPFKQLVTPLGVHLNWADPLTPQKLLSLFDSKLVLGAKE